MRFLELGDSCIMLEREANFVQPLQQNMLAEFIDLKVIAETSRVGDRLRRQIDSQGITLLILRAPEKFIDLRFRKSHRKNSVHETVAVENIGIARRDQNSKAIVGDRPRGVLAA